jgi:hypothetical protein
MLTQDFADIMTCLNQQSANYVLVGAFAMAHFGYRRATGDIDLFVEPTSENSHRVIQALRDFGAPLDAHGVDRDYFASKGNFYQIGVPPSRVDIITEISGVTFTEAKMNAVGAQLAGIQVTVLSLNLLIQNKKASGRAKDLVDVAELEKILQQEKTR